MTSPWGGGFSGRQFSAFRCCGVHVSPNCEDRYPYPLENAEGWRVVDAQGNPTDGDGVWQCPLCVAAAELGGTPIPPLTFTKLAGLQVGPVVFDEFDMTAGVIPLEGEVFRIERAFRFTPPADFEETLYRTRIPIYIWTWRQSARLTEELRRKRLRREARARAELLSVIGPDGWADEVTLAGPDLAYLAVAYADQAAELRRQMRAWAVHLAQTAAVRVGEKERMLLGYDLLMAEYPHWGPHEPEPRPPRQVMGSEPYEPYWWGP